MSKKLKIIAPEIVNAVSLKRRLGHQCCKTGKDANITNKRNHKKTAVYFIKCRHIRDEFLG
jgi:hypothetical protein